MEQIMRIMARDRADGGRGETFNRVGITTEAIFDYEHCLFERSRPPWEECLTAVGGDSKKAFEYAGRFDGSTARLDQKQLKAEIEEYINSQNRSGRLLFAKKIRHTYLDERSGRMLTLFLHRGSGLGTVQNWLLEGVCFAEDYCGAERVTEAWLDCKVTGLDYDSDWVVNLRASARKEFAA